MVPALTALINLDGEPSGYATDAQDRSEATYWNCMLDVLERTNCGGIVRSDSGAIVGLNSVALRLLKKISSGLGQGRALGIGETLQLVLHNSLPRQNRASNTLAIAIRHDTEGRVVIGTLPVGLPRRHTLLIIMDVDNYPRPKEQTLQQIWGLTPDRGEGGRGAGAWRPTVGSGAGALHQTHHSAHPPRIDICEDPHPPSGRTRRALVPRRHAPLMVSRWRPGCQHPVPAAAAIAR